MDSVLTEVMDQGTIRDTYTDMLFSGEQTRVRNSFPPFRFLHPYLPSDKKVPILDAGCGDGGFAHKLATMGFAQIDAVDLFDQIETHSTFRYRKASVAELPFDGASFELAYSLSVLYYLDDPRDGISEVFRVLRPGGYFLMTAHTKYSLHTLDRVIRRRFGGVKHLEGIRFRTAGAYKDMFRECGFKEIQMAGYDQFYPLRNPIKKAWRKFVVARMPLRERSRRRPGLWQSLSANLGYHSILIGRKQAT